MYHSLAIKHCAAPVAADFNHDCAVDSRDMEIFEACATGSAGRYYPLALPPGCHVTHGTDGEIAVDFDKDGDVDQQDFSVVQRCYSGRNVPANP